MWTLRWEKERKKDTSGERDCEYRNWSTCKIHIYRIRLHEEKRVDQDQKNRSTGWLVFSRVELQSTKLGLGEKGIIMQRRVAFYNDSRFKLSAPSRLPGMGFAVGQKQFLHGRQFVACNKVCDLSLLRGSGSSEMKEENN